MYINTRWSRPCEGLAWWCHQMETYSVLLALCDGNPTETGGFPSQRPVMQSFGVFFDLHLNNRSRRQWFETPSCSLWRHRYESYPDVTDSIAVWRSSSLIHPNISRRATLNPRNLTPYIIGFTTLFTMKSQNKHIWTVWIAVRLK